MVDKKQEIAMLIDPPTAEEKRSSILGMHGSALRAVVFGRLSVQRQHNAFDFRLEVNSLDGCAVNAQIGAGDI